MPDHKVSRDIPGWYENIRVQFDDVDLMALTTMEISASPGYQPYDIVLSDIAEDLFALTDWLARITDLELPAECIIDRSFIFWAGALSEDRIDFRIRLEAAQKKDGPPEFQTVASRKQFVKQFVKSIRELISRNYIYLPGADSGLGDPNQIQFGELLAKLRKS